MSVDQVKSSLTVRPRLPDLGRQPSDSWIVGPTGRRVMGAFSASIRQGVSAAQDKPADAKPGEKSVIKRAKPESARDKDGADRVKQETADRMNDAATREFDKQDETAPVKPGKDDKRPEGDNRTAEQIIADSELLANLGNQDGAADKLKDIVGDYTKDPDAAYRAVKLLEYLEKVDRNGKPIKPFDNDQDDLAKDPRFEMEDSGNGKIDGWTEDGEARHTNKQDSEAARLQDFCRAGEKDGKDAAYDTLGDTGSKPLTPVKAEDITAQDILENSSLFQQLPENVKEDLKKRFGDYENDADAAARLVGKLEEIANLKGADGRERSGGVAGNGRIDGFDQEGKGAHGTEAGALQDFIKDGNSAIEGRQLPPEPPLEVPDAYKIPADDKRTAEEIIDADPVLKNLSQEQKDDLKKRLGDYEHDPARAYAASQVIAHIQMFDGDGKEIKGKSGDKNDPLNDKLDGFNKNGDANKNTEAERFNNFVENGFDTLKGDLGDKKPAATKYDEIEKFTRDLIEDGYDKFIEDANLPEDRQDILKNPDKYTTEQRAAAIMELRIAGANMIGNPELYQPNNGNGPVTGLPQDITKEGAIIQEAINKLENEETKKFLEENDLKLIQDALAGNPAKRSEAEALFEDMTKNGAGFDQYLKKYKGNMVEAMKAYQHTVDVLNLALGKDGEVFEDNVSITFTGANADKLNKELEKSFNENFKDPNTLKDLIDKGMTEEEAAQEMMNRAQAYLKFGVDPDWVQSAMKDNTTQWFGAQGTPDDIARSGYIKADGTVDEDFLNKVLDEARKNDPDIFGKGDEALTNAQIITGFRGAWDAARNAAKVDGAYKKMDLAGFMDKNNPLNKTFGSGTMHIVSSLFAGAIGIARSQTGSELSPAEKIGILGGAVQALGLGIQGFEFTNRNKPAALSNFVKNLAHYFGNVSPETTIESAKKQWTNVMNFGKVLNGAGGLMLGATGLVIGAAAYKRGDKTEAALYFTQGAANTISSLGPLIEAGSHAGSQYVRGKPLSPQTTGQLFRFLGIGAGIANIIAFGSIFIYEIVTGVRDGKKSDEYYKSFLPTLEEYGLAGDKDKPTGPYVDDKDDAISGS